MDIERRKFLTGACGLVAVSSLPAAEKGLPLVLAMHVPILTPELWRFTKRYWNQVNTKYVSAAIPDPSCGREVLFT